jgi:Xaa-Pro dipeptidase
VIHEVKAKDTRERMLHFDRSEFDVRIASARKALRERGLDALLIFAQESHYYLTGYDSVGYVFFQCAVLTTDESQPITLLTRRPDLVQAHRTSILEDVRLWFDAEGANPADDLKAILAEKGLGGTRIGIEMNTHGLTGANYERVRRALEGWCVLEDASLLVRRLRVAKSPAEIRFVRQAAKLADAALRAMVAAAGPGVLEGEISAAGLNAILSGGGDTPPAGPLLNSGERALFGRSVCGPRRLEATDQVLMEFAATYCRYNACLERTVLIGSATTRHQTMFDVSREALAAMTEAAKPGRPLGEIDEAHRRVYDAAGFQKYRFSACGYSLGATYRPLWMDVPPMLYAGNPMLAQSGMVLFLHAMLSDTDTGTAMGLGHTILVTDSGREVLSGESIELPVRT